MSGGVEVPNPARPFLPNFKFFLNNTEFNLTKFFAGDYDNFKNYNFVVGTTSPPAPGLGGGGFFAPYSYNYYGKNRVEGLTPQNLKDRNMVVAQSGNGYSPIYFLDKGETQDPTLRKSYYELTHYSGKNIVADLLNYQFKKEKTNLVGMTSTEKELGLDRHLMELNGLRPIGLFTMALQGDSAKNSADSLAGFVQNKKSTEEPILIQTRGAADKIRSALILTSREGGVDKHRYIRLYKVIRPKTLRIV
jgi:hypothetical protein